MVKVELLLFCLSPSFGEGEIRDLAKEVEEWGGGRGREEERERGTVFFRPETVTVSLFNFRLFVTLLPSSLVRRTSISQG